MCLKFNHLKYKWSLDQWDCRLQWTWCPYVPRAEHIVGCVLLQRHSWVRQFAHWLWSNLFAVISKKLGMREPATKSFYTDNKRVLKAFRILCDIQHIIHIDCHIRIAPICSDPCPSPVCPFGKVSLMYCQRNVLKWPLNLASSRIPTLENLDFSFFFSFFFFKQEFLIGTDLTQNSTYWHQHGHPNTHDDW